MSIFVINTIILFAIDIYIYLAIRGTNIRWAKSKLFSVLWWSYSALLIIGIIISINVDIRLTVRSIILVAFFITFVSKFVYMLVLFVDDLRRGLIWSKRYFYRLTRKQAPEGINKKTPLETSKRISRSDFLAKSGIVVAAIPFAGLSWGIVGGAYDYRIRKQKLYLPNLPAAFHGMTIAQISDIHSGSFYNKKAVIGGVEKIMAQKPDVVFFTGDLVNNLASELSDYKDIFAKIKAPLGVYSILGNHDYGEYHFGREPSAAKARNLELIKNAEREMGWDLLLNENRRLRVDNEEIGILGVENWGKGRFPRYGDIEKTLQNTEDLPVKLLLSHDPSHWRGQILDHPDIDVMFSGHTHGMQFGVRAEHFQWSPVQYLYPEWAGLYQQKRQQLYVNVGFGFLGYPGRVGMLPEITIFELIKGTNPIIAG